MSAAGVIVGSHLKSHGHWFDALDPIRLNHFMKKVKRLRDQDEQCAALEDSGLEEEDQDEEERLKARIVNQGE